MQQKSLSKWIKVIILVMAICGFLIFTVIFPVIGKDIIEEYPVLSDRFWPWLIFFWALGVSYYITLYFGWKIAHNIGEDRSFSHENAIYLKYVSWIEAIDALFIFCVNVIYLVIKLSHPAIALLSLLVVFVAIAISVFFASLSHLVEKAAAMKDENDLTI